MATPKNIQFKLIRVDVPQFAVVADAYEDNKDDIGLQLGVRILATDREKVISVLFDSKFYCKENPFIILSTSCDFEIEEKAFAKMQKDENTLVIPKGFAQHLAVITAGTSRGVLHEKLNKTEFSRFILPTVDLTKVLTDDIELKMNEEVME